MRLLTHCLVLIVLLLMLPASVLAAKKVALVIGNDTYENVTSLEKATNDAASMAETLARLGFEVIVAKDATRREMNRRLQEFSSIVSPGDVTLFFYAGHAIEIAGENFLLPVDIPGAAQGEEAFVKSEAIGLNDILNRMRDSRARLNIAILDSCRNNPFADTTGRSVGATRGLARIAAPTGTFVMYSADAGQEALDRLGDDDDNPNSVFTRTLIPLMMRPGLDLADLAREVRRDVHKLAGTVSHQQTPAYYDAILGNFQFREADVPLAVAAVAPAPAPVPEAPSRINQDYLSAERIGSRAAWEVFLARYGERTDNFHVQLARAALQEFAALAPTGQSRPKTAPAQTLTPRTQTRRDSTPEQAPATTRGATPGRDCDRLAGDPDDGNAVSPGVAARDLDLARAVGQCRAAVDAFPDTPRFAHQLARSLEQAGNYTETLQWYRQAGEAGYQASMVGLGFLLSRGKIGPRDYGEARRWFRKAAQLGNSAGMFGMGVLSEEGLGIGKDATEAAVWFRRAAELGNPAAMHRLGWLYHKGAGVEKDFAQASRWFRRAAEKGNGDGMFSLGYLYFNGEGVDKSHGAAAYWFELAGEKGVPDAMGYLGVMYHAGNGLERNQTLAAKWTAAALKNGYEFSLSQMTGNARAYNQAFRRALQVILRNEGYYSGSIDGAFGPGTKRAVQAYFGSALR